MIRASANTEQQTWDVVIEPSGSYKVNLKAIWHYRDLLGLLVRRDFVSFYKQTILGPLWFFVQPLLTAIMFTLVFGRLAAIPTDGLPAPLFYLAGITAWNYFADCLTKTSTVFKDNAAMFGKVYFPRLIVPLSIVLSNLVRFAVQLVLFLLATLFYVAKGTEIVPTLSIFLFPVVIVVMAAMGLGAGMVISALTTKYRDLAFLVAFGVQLLMYGTTVIYPLSAVGPKYRWLLQLNPLTPLIEIFRKGFLGKGSYTFLSLTYAAAVALALLIGGGVIFNKVEKNFVDTV